MKPIKQILSLSILIIILIIGFILYQVIYKPSNPDLNCRIPVPFCDTKKPKLTENQYKGKEIFNSNCAACHKLNSKTTGPALHEVDSLVFINWLTNKKYKIDSTKVEILAIDYHKTVFSKTLTKKDVTDLIEYCHSE